MVEINFAREISTTVEAFLILGMRTQTIYRVILSRLYYAAHHVGRLLLRNVGIAPEQWRGDVHRRVINELERRLVNTGVMSRNAWEALCRLRISRIRADYEIAMEITDYDIAQALNLFTIYFENSQQVLGVI